MTDIPKELIPTIVLLWMQMHTAKRRGVFLTGECMCELSTPCPECGCNECLHLTINSAGHIHLHCGTLDGCSFCVHEQVTNLMPAGPDSVGIADFTPNVVSE